MPQRHFIALQGGRHLHHDPFMPDLIPDSGTIRSMPTTGRSSEPTTWGGWLPRTTDRVVIPAGSTVLVDRDFHVHRVKIEFGGTLKVLEDRNVILAFETLQSIEGDVQIGSIDPAIRHEVIILDVSFELDEDPGQYGHGILCVGGNSVVKGAPKTTWSWLSDAPLAGQDYLDLAQAPAGWRRGDKIVIPDTRQLRRNQDYFSAPEWEEHYVDRVVDRRVYLQGPLLYNHHAGRDIKSSKVYYPFVENLTRNTVIRSEGSKVPGHTFCTDRCYVHWGNVLIQDMGRTTIGPLDDTEFDEEGTPTHVGGNQKARYPVHLHHLSGPRPGQPTPEGYQFVVRGLAIDGSPKWAGSIHDASYGLFTQNVSYKCDGAHWVVEAGNETENLFLENACMVGYGHLDTGDRGADQFDFGHGGDGWWIAGLGNRFEGNVCANARAEAYDFYTFLGVGASFPQRLPSFPGAETHVDGEYTLGPIRQKIPVLSFRDNVGFACGFGTVYWMVHNDAHWLQEGTILWHCQHASMDSRYQSGVYLKDCEIIANDSLRGEESNVASGFSAAAGCELHFEDCRIIGFVIGMLTTSNENITVEGGTLFNTTDVGLYPSRNTHPVRHEFHCELLGETKIAKWGFISGPHDAPDTIYGGVSHPSTDIFALEQTFVRSNTGTLQIFYHHQHPDYVVDSRISPDPGKTNAQLFAERGICLSGELATCATEMGGYHGYVCSVT